MHVRNLSTESVLILLGVSVGLMDALAGGRWIAALLFGVTPADPATFAALRGRLNATEPSLPFPPLVAQHNAAREQKCGRDHEVAVELRPEQRLRRRPIACCSACGRARAANAPP